MATDPLTILHVDMDAFYASVEQRDRPSCAASRLSSAASGPRRRLRRLLRGPQVRRPQRHADSSRPAAFARTASSFQCAMQHYAEISRQIRNILLSFTPLVEPLSLDEAFLDVHGCEGLFGPAPEIGRQIKDRIRAETGLVASVGVAPNKFLAKLASDQGKPDGFVVLLPEEVEAFLAPLPIGRLWGVGAKGEQRLHALGIRTVGPARLHCPSKNWQTASAMSADTCGSWRTRQDDRSVVPDREAKSISTETTFAQDISDRHVLRVSLLDLVDHLATRLRKQKVRARTIEIKLRSSDFRTQLRQQALPEATNSTDVLWQAAKVLFEKSLTGDLLPLRLLGVGATRLTRDAVVQGGLFDGEVRRRQQALDQTIDAIRQQLGANAIQRASLLNRPGQEEY